MNKIDDLRICLDQAIVDSDPEYGNPVVLSIKVKNGRYRTQIEETLEEATQKNLLPEQGIIMIDEMVSEDERLIMFSTKAGHKAEGPLKEKLSGLLNTIPKSAYQINSTAYLESDTADSMLKRVL